MILFAPPDVPQHVLRTLQAYNCRGVKQDTWFVSCFCCSVPMCRGMPTCHVKYGEDIAILAGDALLSKSFEHCAKVLDCH